MSIWQWFIRWLGQRGTLWLLFVVNLFGTIYGYYWYKNQLLQTDLHLLPFVPDSPTASLFFTLVLLAFLLKKRWPLLEALATVTLVKYGIWATVMIVWGAALGAPMYWQHYMLIFSHIGMAIQAVLYTPYFRFKFKHLVWTGAWTLLNDLVDYSLGTFPTVNERLHVYLPTIAFFTVSLSLCSLYLAYRFVVHKRVKRLDLDF
ncbi:DUF1405 domain-containing protein [Caldalkalibacillus salinus]|uniref:DUF1405 domain-containing protein n=1 Tax=Caldalkalibacillus salinus TaxID=2803787 RepID=UPI001922EB5D|nr:DUF1405 domain-containing protein [Caldalkalibacillus salinus]